MRKRPQQNNNYGHQKRRHSHGGGSNNGGGGNRPRRNYSAAREKYLAQARDALSAGDRVMAEYFYQHADHCFRMMMEEGYRNPRPQSAAPVEGEEAADSVETDVVAEVQNANANPLPAFITGYGAEAKKTPEDQIPVQNWEERDA